MFPPIVLKDSLTHMKIVSISTHSHKRVRLILNENLTITITITITICKVSCEMMASAGQSHDTCDTAYSYKYVEYIKIPVPYFL